MDNIPTYLNWTPLDRMTASERLDELARLLSAGLIRMFAAQSSSLSPTEPQTVIDFSPLKSGVHRRKLRNRGD